jgi:surface antigen
VLPDAFKTADNASKAVLVISKEIKTTRESIPATMDRADKLIANAREAGQQASSGAVSGIFTGILMAPFDFVGSVSDTLIGDDEVSKKLSDKDNEDIEKATSEILTVGNVGDKNAWSNKDSGNSGLIELVDISDDDDGDECREIQIVIKHKDEEIQNKKTTLCNQGGKWDLK